MKHYLAFSVLIMVSLLMACCLTSAIQRVAPNLASEAKTAVVTQAEGLGKNLAETLMPSMDVSTLEAQAQTLLATAVQGAGQQLVSTPQPSVPNTGGQAPAGVPADFPVTQDATNLKVLSTGAQAQINYQTKMGLPEVMSFCTVQLSGAGWTLQPNMLSLSDTTFSITFTSSSNPSDIVIQGVTVGAMTNVNVRYEVIK
jgi:hypothetical protein